MFHVRRNLIAFALAVSPLAGQTSTGAARVEPEGVGLCFTNLQGLGICEADQFCPEGAECDATTPCADGKVCTVGTNCKSLLPGVCLFAYLDGGCSNPGTLATGFEVCEPIVFHEDFKPLVVAPDPTRGAPPPGLHQMSVSSVCGSGSYLFENESCAATVGASSPRATARWGVALNCASYASASHRVVASTGAVDVSGCVRAELDFDYVVELSENGSYDRAFVTVSVDGGQPEVIATNQTAAGPAFSSSVNSCAGTVLPVGNLRQDGGWHHYRAGLGDGNSVVVQFWGEVSDGLFNSGQGWFFDDVRIDCGRLIFQDGFNGANLLRWSATTAPPLLVGVESPGSCGNYLSCAGPESSCLNFQSAEGPSFCVTSSLCGSPCATSAGCGAGQICIVNSCCPGDGSTCAVASCDPDGGFFLPDAEGAPTSGG